MSARLRARSGSIPYLPASPSRSTSDMRWTDRLISSAIARSRSSKLSYSLMPRSSQVASPGSHTRQAPEWIPSLAGRSTLWNNQPTALSDPRPSLTRQRGLSVGGGSFSITAVRTAPGRPETDRLNQNHKHHREDQEPAADQRAGDADCQRYDNQDGRRPI